MSRAIQHGYESKSAMICGFDPLCFVYRLTGLHARGTGVASVCEHVPATSNLFAFVCGTEWNVDCLMDCLRRGLVVVAKIDGLE